MRASRHGVCSPAVGVNTVLAAARQAKTAAAKGAAGFAGARRRLDPAAGAVAITFDDGPDPRFTPGLLDRLAALDVKATFFVLGDRVRAHPDLIRRMHAEGHAVGTHSATHADGKQTAWPALVRDYRAGREAVEEVLGRPVRLFRPPQGYVNVRVATAVRAVGLRAWLWTIDPKDWVPATTADAIVAGAEPLAAGDVVVLHDSMANPKSPEALDRTATLEAVPRIVALARQRDLRLTTLAG